MKHDDTNIAVKYSEACLWTIIAKNDSGALKQWLEINHLKKNYDLNKPILENLFNSQIPIFLAVDKKNLSVFKQLIEDGKIDLSTTANGITVLHAIAITRWQEGLDYLVQHHRNIIARTENFQRKGFPIFHALTRSIESNPKNKKTDLDTFLKLLELDKAIDLLLNQKVAGKTALDNLTDNKIKNKIYDTIGTCKTNTIMMMPEKREKQSLWLTFGSIFHRKISANASLFHAEQEITPFITL